MSQTNPFDWAPYVTLICFAGWTAYMVYRRDWLCAAGLAGFVILMSTQRFAPTLLPLGVKWPLLVGSSGLLLWVMVRNWIRNDPRATNKSRADS